MKQPTVQSRWAYRRGTAQAVALAGERRREGLGACRPGARPIRPSEFPAQRRTRTGNARPDPPADVPAMQELRSAGRHAGSIRAASFSGWRAGYTSQALYLRQVQGGDAVVAGGMPGLVEIVGTWTHRGDRCYRIAIPIRPESPGAWPIEGCHDAQLTPQRR